MNIPLVSNDHPQVVRQPYDTEAKLNLNPEGAESVADGYDGMRDPLVRLSKNMKLSMKHVGFVENAIDSTDEWKYENGEAVAPDYFQDKDRRNGAKYTKTTDKIYSNYGKLETVEVFPYGEDTDPAQPAEKVSTLKITDGTGAAPSDSDKDLVDAVPVLALNREQEHLRQREGRRGEVDTDPITPDNYLDRPGLYVKTSETYLDIQEKAAAEETEEEEEEIPPPQDDPQAPTYTVVPNDAEFDSNVTYYTKVGDDYVEATGITEFASGTTYYTRDSQQVTPPQEDPPAPTYTAVPEDAEFDSNVTYYTKEGDVYTAATGITEFAEGVTYYTLDS